MVDSPLYACQFVFVVNDAAVLNARGGGTGPNPCGLNGSTCCSRCSAYKTSIETTLKRSSATAYSVHRISWSSSTPVVRYTNRSIGRITGSSHVRSRAKTRLIKLPSGGVTRKTASRKSRICSQPFGVMSELLRLQHPENQVAEHADAHEEPNHVFQGHGHLPADFINRSQAAT